MNRMIFRNYGGNYQLEIETIEDLKKVLDLHDARWAASSVPIYGLNCDDRFLEMMDTDNNDRVRPDEVRDAIHWLLTILKNHDCLLEGTEILKLEDLDRENSEAQKINDSAKLVLSNLGDSLAEEITLEQVRSLQKIKSNAASNGDGIIPPEATDDEDLANFIQTIMDTVGAVEDISGKQGVNIELLEKFLKASEEFLQWKTRGEVSISAAGRGIRPWGGETPDAWKMIEAIDAKIEEYFTQCEMIAFDERSAKSMLLTDGELKELNFADSAVMANRLGEAPLSTPNAEGKLDLTGYLNPLYEKQLKQLQEKVLYRALSSSTQLTREDWQQVKTIFAEYAAWYSDEIKNGFEDKDSELIQKYQRPEYADRLKELAQKDKEVADELEEISNVEKLILYKRWMLEFVNNCVSFPALYNPERNALLEMGKLIIGGRVMTFTVDVKDRAKHKKVAKDSLLYLLYLEISRFSDQSKKFEVAAAVTSGNAQGFYLGKRGIFYTPDGTIWDAVIVDIVENPVSLTESAKEPFKKIGQLISKQVEKFTAAQQKKIESAVVSPTATSAMRDLLLGGGIAISAMGSSIAYITKTFSETDLSFIKIIYGLLGILAVIIIPSIFLGWLRLRRRNMSTVLEASGWAVNLRMRLSGNLGRLFTYRQPLPKDSKINYQDLALRYIKSIEGPNPEDRPFSAIKTEYDSQVAPLVEKIQKSEEKKKAQRKQAEQKIIEAEPEIIPKPVVEPKIEPEPVSNPEPIRKPTSVLPTQAELDARNKRPSKLMSCVGFIIILLAIVIIFGIYIQEAKPAWAWEIYDQIMRWIYN